MKKILSIILLGFSMVSCIDTIVIPDNKTVEEDFWQTKSDVAMMVNGAYAEMANSDLQQRLVVWASRSDELNVNSSLNNRDLNQIYSANIQTTNGYCNWNTLYSTINACNLVISKSEEVMSIDPNYLEGDHRNNVGQMKALRSLCYFYLVRVFRDVPLILEPYKLSSQNMNVPQTAPSIVIDQIIADLEEVKNYTLSSQTITDRIARCGYFTRDGVYALLADVYLWKASVLGDESCYDKCIECCNTIRNNRKNAMSSQGNFKPDGTLFDDDGYDLNTYLNYFSLFTQGGNDQESLFELQFTNNEGLCKVYNKNSNNANAQPQFFTNNVYAKIATGENYIFNHDNYKYDVRGFQSVFGFNAAEEEGFMIRKHVDEGMLSSVLMNQEQKAIARVDRAYTGYDQNWIVYRVTDVMLMKAEALVQKALMKVQSNSYLLDEIAAATTPEDSLALANQLQEINQTISSYNVTAVRQAQIVSMRAIAKNDIVSQLDSTKYIIPKLEYDGTNLAAYVNRQVNTFTGFTITAEELETLVMNERARELCFEGKRWFDMLRYNYRHVTDVNYDIILAEQGAHTKNYEEMLKLIARKYTSGGGSGVTAKMPTEPYLYMPIAQSEIEVNSALKQNPVYTDGGTMEKN